MARNRKEIHDECCHESTLIHSLHDGKSLFDGRDCSGCDCRVLLLEPRSLLACYFCRFLTLSLHEQLILLLCFSGACEWRQACDGGDERMRHQWSHCMVVCQEPISNHAILLSNMHATIQPTIQPTISTTIQPTIRPTIQPTISTNIQQYIDTNIPLFDLWW